MDGLRMILKSQPLPCFSIFSFSLCYDIVKLNISELQLVGQNKTLKDVTIENV